MPDGWYTRECWLARTRSWASSPPPASEDRLTVVPPRRTTQEKKDVESPAGRARPTSRDQDTAPSGAGARETRTREGEDFPAPATRAIRGTSDASSIVQGGGHGTAAMRYAARHTALTRVEEILAHSYSSRDMAPSSPNAFGAAPASLEDIAWAAGIEQRLAAATSAERAGMEVQQRLDFEGVGFS
ncbi:hypothetical protein BJV78DRAFT_1282330 [Lactifluus subvellereus]|nr:hypothetical protein BJV78DRAFT_1282330 [Lactifluus subvellereus]